MEKSFKRELRTLDRVFEFVDEFVASNGLGDDVAFPLKLAVEELFTNFVRHNSGGQDSIYISLNKADGRLVIKLKDFDVEPFDGMGAPRVNVRQSLRERKVGGLGIHLIRSLFDTLEYDYKDRTLCVTATKKLT
jgi:anti-sigma regulatory factor (Ser/Thr protein kinase)